jgi:hypothetical protein
LFQHKTLATFFMFLIVIMNPNLWQLEDLQQFFMLLQNWVNVKFYTKIVVSVDLIN